MLSSRNGRRQGVALASAALLASLGFIAAAVAIEPAPGAGAPAAGAAIRLAQNAPAKASYSDDQADRGEKRFKSECVECHGHDLKGGINGGAPLRGLAFEGKYFEGLPASVLFAFMSTAMPPNSPGRYSPNTYADLMAYVLKRNGFQNGASLPSDLDALDNLVLEK